MCTNAGITHQYLKISKVKISSCLISSTGSIVLHIVTSLASSFCSSLTNSTGLISLSTLIQPSYYCHKGIRLLTRIYGSSIDSLGRPVFMSMVDELFKQRGKFC